MLAAKCTRLVLAKSMIELELRVSAPTPCATRVPSETPLNRNVPPFSVTVALLLMRSVTLLLPLKSNVPPLFTVTDVVPLIWPDVPALAISRVPPLMIVAPVYVLLPERTQVPLEVLVMANPPAAPPLLIAPLMDVVPWEFAPVRVRVMPWVVVPPLTAPLICKRLLVEALLNV